jgi:hypothetical protein
MSQIISQVRSAFCFSVDKFPLRGPDGMKTPFYGLFRSDSGECVGSRSVSSRYTPHTTEDIVALVEAAATAFEGIAEVKTAFRDGHFLAITPSKEYRKSIFGTSDNIFPRVMLDASYDGRSFRGMCGFFRDACRNMAILKMVTGTQVTIRHTSGLRSAMDELVQQFGQLRHGWEGLTAAATQMEARRVNMVDFLNRLYGEPDSTARSVTMHRNRTQAIFTRLYNERLNTGRAPLGQDWIVSGWEAYNAVQGYTQHDSIRRGRLSEMDRIILAAGDDAVARAEQLAYEMAL